jgi:outer membrane protein
LSGLSIPDYRGSDEQRQYVLPLPYIVYRGEVIRSDRRGLYGVLFQSDRVRLNVSTDASVPVNSEKNTARSGMSNLDPVFQIGPSLEICLSSECTDNQGVELRLPVRAAFASDLSYVSGTGFIANPNLNVDFYLPGNNGGWNLGFAAGPLFATRQYHAHYYEIAPQYAVPGRRDAYHASGGYRGSLIVFALSKRFDRFWFGAFGRYDELTRAVFSDSPLVSRKHSYMAGFGIAWVFDKSTIMVKVK